MDILSRISSAVLTALALPFFLFVMVPIGVVLRASNEITTRAFGKAVVVCPHCGAPGIVDSEHPKVVR